jgi:hypothetical protein
MKLEVWIWLEISVKMCTTLSTHLKILHTTGIKVGVLGLAKIYAGKGNI